MGTPQPGKAGQDAPGDEEGRATHGTKLVVEQLLADPPDLLLIAGDERAQRHPALGNLADTRVETFDPSLLYCGGPSVIRTAARLRELH